MSRRLTRKELDEIRRAYHMDLEKVGCQRVAVDGAIYAGRHYVERLVDEVEALWRARRKAK